MAPTTSVLEAIERGDLATVEAALDDGFDPDSPLGDGDLALCWAGAYGQVEIVELLLGRGASVDARPDHGMGGPALADALFENQMEAARVLVSAGAEVDYASAAALGLLDRMIGHEETHSERWGAFLSACKTGQVAVAQYLVPRGIDVAIYPPGDEWGGIGASGLHWAASAPNVELARWLVAEGTPVDIVDDTFGNTPLGWALLDGHDEVAEALLQLGADPTRAKT